MGRQDGVAGTTNDAVRRGLWRLMLRLPAIRGRLQIAAARSARLDDLFEAYEVAAVALERFQRAHDCPKVLEYESVCHEIEADVIQYLLQSQSDVQD